SGAELDHAVRTVPQARRVARTDLKVALGLLSARHVAGDPDLTERLRAGALEDWRAAAPPRPAGLHAPPAPPAPDRGEPPLPAERRPLADGVVEQDGEVVLARAADPASDPPLVLRAAAAAAQAGLPLAPRTLDRLTECPPLPVPWPAAARDALLSLLGAGHAA